MTAQPEMTRRVAAAQATLDRWKDVPFAFGKADCARMVASHLRGMGFKLKIGKAGDYRTPLSAARALKRAGFDSLADAMDKHGFVRIAPAAAIAGDVLALPAVDSLGALCVALGNGRVIGWIDGIEVATLLQPDYALVETAWRVPA